MAAAPTTTLLFFELTIDSVSDRLHVASVEGFEGFSELFQFHVTFATSDKASLSELVGKDAVLTLRGESEPRLVHGILSRFRQGAAGKRHMVYHATLVPAVYPLLYRQDSRIFQAKTVPAILKAVFEAAGLSKDDYRIALEGDYPEREYCVQYQESDWAFVSRLMEEVGIFYFFEHTPDGSTLVLADGNGAYSPIAEPSTLPFRPPGGALFRGDCITHLERVEELHSGKATAQDYTFLKPKLSLVSTASAERHDDLEVYEYPGGYADPDAGKGVMKVRMEERAARGRILDGHATAARLAPGFTFVVDDHSSASFNGEYVATSVHHEGSQVLMGEAAPGERVGHRIRFSALSSETPFRPPRITARPTIRVQTAVVVGPEGDEIHTDEHGRIKVQFHWDRLGQNDEKSSTWIRVSQPWAGVAWGGMFLPRIGQEVIVDFLEGDPDRPIVVGRVYHAANVPPYALPDNKTKSTLKGKSSPEPDEDKGGNELRFEDKAGEEELFLHAEKDLLGVVENDRKQTVGNDDTLEVTNNRSVSVGVDATTAVEGNDTVTVGGDASLAVTGNRTTSVDGDEELTVGGDATVTMQGGLEHSVTDDAKLQIDGGYQLTVGKSFKIEVTEDATESVTGKKTIEVQGEKLEITCGQSKVKVSQSSVEVEGMEVKLKGQTSATVEGQAQVEVKASGMVTIKGEGSVKVQASGIVQIKGALVQVN